MLTKHAKINAFRCRGRCVRVWSGGVSLQADVRDSVRVRGKRTNRLPLRTSYVCGDPSELFVCSCWKLFQNLSYRIELQSA